MTTPHQQNPPAGAGQVNPNGQVDPTQVDELEEDSITMTQAEFDALVTKRVNREKKKTAKLGAELQQLRQQTQQTRQTQGNTQQQTTPPGGQSDLTADLVKALQQLGFAPQQQQTQQVTAPSTKPNKAVQKAIRKLAESEAKALGVADEFVNATVGLADFSDIEIDDDGDFDEFDIQKALRGVIKANTGFLKTQPTKPPLKGGTAGDKGNQATQLSDFDKALNSRLGLN